MSKAIKLGLVGIGNIGKMHIKNIEAGKAGDKVELVALADQDEEALKAFSDRYACFNSASEMMDSGKIDAVFIATPHYDHTPLSIEGLEKGLHVLVEKPMAVHKADCLRMIEAYENRPNKDQIFAEMFNQRTDPSYIKLRHLIQSGQLGEIRRINWIITNWFRTEEYYRSGGWRATWKGEGGGVLLNQCPHQLDLMQWLFGMPTNVRAFCDIGHLHDIEVEDNVTAYLQYENGARGVFISSTGEAPGTNRLEVAAENGRVVIEDGKFSWKRNEQPMTEYSRTTENAFGGPETWNIDIPISGTGPQHSGILQNFAEAIIDGKELMAPAIEGINSVELGNAMLFSSFTESTLSLPIDHEAYEAHLKKLIAESSFEKKESVAVGSTDMSSSFS